MANVFGILTAIVLSLAAFIAFKNKSAYQARIDETATQKDLLVKSEARLTAAKSTLETLPVELKAVEAESEVQAAADAAQKKLNDGLTEKVTALNATIATNKEKLDAIREKTQKTGDLTELASKMRATNAEIAELTPALDAATSKLANLTAQNSSTDAQVEQAKAKFKDFGDGQSVAALKTRIRSIYPNWGFVTLASGNNAGVVTNSTLNVVRNGETVAKLLVTAVESSSASATIIPDSMTSDVTLAVGDRVEASQKAAKPAGN